MMAHYWSFMRHYWNVENAYRALLTNDKPVISNKNLVEK